MSKHQEQHALILTDSLAATPTDEAFVSQSKTWAIPHMNMAAAITGHAARSAAGTS